MKKLGEPRGTAGGPQGPQGPYPWGGGREPWTLDHIYDIIVDIQTARRETGAHLWGKKEGMLGMRGWRKELAMRLSGIKKSRNSEIQKFRNSGIQDSRNAGSQEFRNLEFKHQKSFTKT